MASRSRAAAYRGRTLDQSPRAGDRKRLGEPMSVVVFVGLTVAVFALLGLVQKLVEGL
ncbi:hypothetical protein ACNQR7_02060 [Mycolicibacterium senegalense]|uniref:hypothetical protein n=1 Tax=Mycolicibacterium TaxID=1866885 RepID=UPI000AAC8AB0|nr:hypothetical protein [Mycolicibacterium conceptionense]